MATGFMSSTPECGYGRGQARKVTVAGTEQQRKACVADAHKRAAQTLERHREEGWSNSCTPDPMKRARNLPGGNSVLVLLSPTVI